MGYHVSEAALEQAVQQMVGHAACHSVGGDAGPIDEAAAFDTVFDERSCLHFAKHGGDGGVREVVVVRESPMNIGNGCLAALPQHLHDPELEIPKTMDFGFTHATPPERP